MKRKDNKIYLFDYLININIIINSDFIIPELSRREKIKL